MPGLIVDKNGTFTEVPLDEIGAEFERFKEDRSRLQYRRRRGDVGTLVNSAWLYDFLQTFSDKLDKVPKRGTREYDEFIDRQWKDEPILSGVVYGMVAKAQTKPWRIEGGRNNATQAARMLSNARYGFYQAGWGGFSGMSALDFYTTRLGFVWGVQRQGSKFGRITSLEHIDALSCDLTGSFTHPVRYQSRETGQVIRFRDTEVIQHNSMTISREEDLGYGFCAVERCLMAIRMLVGLHNYDIEKLSNLPPEGIATITGMTYDEFMDSLQLWKEQRKQDNNLTYPQVLWLLNQSDPSEKLEVQLTSFSQLPENFTRETVILHYINMIANAFGISASDVWFMGGGPFGTGKEVELQHLYATGKGEGEWFSLTQQIINRELPQDTEFKYDTKNVEEDRIAAETAKIWVDAYMPMVEQTQLLQIDVDDWKRLFISKGVLPAWFMEGAEFPPPQTEITSERSLRLKDAQDIVAFVWEMGRIKERPVITTYRRKEGPGRGWWGPPKGTHGGGEDVSKLSRAELEKRGYMAVFRGTGPKGAAEMRPSETGQMGPGIYFYDTPIKARSYAEPGGGIITAFVKPGEGVKVFDVPASTFDPAHKLIVAQTRDLVIRRGTIPTEKTIIRGYGKKAYEAFEKTASDALEEFKEDLGKPKIRGDPIPDHEVERGARVTRKAVLAEQEKWGKIPELAGLVEREGDEKPPE